MLHDKKKNGHAQGSMFLPGPGHAVPQERIQKRERESPTAHRRLVENHVADPRPVRGSARGRKERKITKPVRPGSPTKTDGTARIGLKPIDDMSLSICVPRLRCICLQSTCHFWSLPLRWRLVCALTGGRMYGSSEGEPVKSEAWRLLLLRLDVAVSRVPTPPAHVPFMQVRWHPMVSAPSPRVDGLVTANHQRTWCGRDSPFGEWVLLQPGASRALIIKLWVSTVVPYLFLSLDLRDICAHTHTIHPPKNRNLHPCDHSHTLSSSA